MDSQVKDALREAARTVRLARSAEQIADGRAGVRAAVLARCAADAAAGRPWTCVAGYVPLRTEPGSTELLDELAARGIQVIVPVLRADRDLDWTVWSGSVQPDGPRSGLLGLAALAGADAVLVPALAVDARGARLGRGGGSYDRALPRVRAGVAVAALLFDGERSADPLPADPWDVPVSAVATPSGWHDLAR